MNDPLGLSPEQRRAAEKRVLERYAAEVDRRIEIRSGQRTPWPVKPGRRNVFEHHSGVHADELWLEGEFPDTQVVMRYRHRLRPDHQFEIAWSVWPEEAVTTSEPPYDDAFVLDLRESIFEQIRHVDAQPRARVRRMTYPASLAARRAAEERLRARYESQLMKTVELGPNEFTKWPVGPGTVQVTEANIGAFVEQVLLEGEFPSSSIVIVFRHQLRPGDRLAWHFAVWPLGSLRKPEPPYDDSLWINFDEWIAANIRRAPALRD